jgi:hypothetical protein
MGAKDGLLVGQQFLGQVQDLNRNNPAAQALRAIQRDRLRGRTRRRAGRSGVGYRPRPSPGRTFLRSNGTSTCAFGLPQPVTGSQPGRAR